MDYYQEASRAYACSVASAVASSAAIRLLIDEGAVRAAAYYDKRVSRYLGKVSGRRGHRQSGH